MVFKILLSYIGRAGVSITTIAMK